MTTVHRLGAHDPALLAGLDPGSRPYLSFTKGSAEGLLALSSWVWAEGAAAPWTTPGGGGSPPPRSAWRAGACGYSASPSGCSTPCRRRRIAASSAT